MKKFLLLTTLMSTNAFAAPSQYIGLSSSGFSWNTEKMKETSGSKAVNTTNLNVNLQYGYQVHKYVNVGGYLGTTYKNELVKDANGKKQGDTESRFIFNVGLVSEINFMGDFANSPYLGVATGLAYRSRTVNKYLDDSEVANAKTTLPKGFGFELSPYLGYNIPLTALGATNVVFAPEIGYKMTIQMGDDNKKYAAKQTTAFDSVMNHAVVVKLGFKLLF